MRCFSDGMPIPVSETSKGHDRRWLPQHRMVVAPATRGHRHRQIYAAVFGELECVGQQVLEHLLQTLRVGDQTAGKVRIGVHLEAQPPAFRLVAEGAGHHVEQAGEEDLLGIHRDRARFDLREIENVADQVQQIGPGAVNGARELYLPRSQVAVRVVGELLAQHQDAV